MPARIVSSTANAAAHAHTVVQDPPADGKTTQVRGHAPSGETRYCRENREKIIVNYGDDLRRENLLVS